MRRKLVVGNWKMNGSIAKNKLLLDSVIAGVQDLQHVDCVVCVPYPYLCQTQALALGTKLMWGAQNLCASEDSVLTGGVSAHMLVDYGCRYVIVGHSERRMLSHETDDTAAARFNAAIKAGLTPIFCMGETKDERESDWTEYMVGRQLDSILRRFGPEVVAKAVLAYEPLWAVGTNNPATPEQAQQVHQFIRHRVAKCDARVAKSVRILYGGSIQPSNAAALFAMPDIDGGLVGRCSLDAQAFVAICAAAN
ncbi:MAG TPA: triose-phosphate isomerase [Methylotenera sp.]|nr:triose-phosphate isomerase [Methylotenera sp.]